MMGRLFSCRNQRDGTHASLIRKSAASCRMVELPGGKRSIYPVTIQLTTLYASQIADARELHSTLDRIK